MDDKIVNPELLEIIPTLHYLKKGKEITKALRLEEDLYIYGDDAVEFLDTYSKRFDVDISEFSYSYYFTPEVYYPFIYKLIPNLSKKRGSLTLADLEKGIQCKELNDKILRGE